jgi:hypothetical protein
MADDKTKAEMVRGSRPVNVVDAERPIPKLKQPNDGVTSFKVHTRGVTEFRRAGIKFGVDTVTVDAASISREQQVDLLNTPELDVEQVGGSAHVEEITKPGGESPIQKPGSAPASTVREEPSDDATRARKPR